MKLKFCKVSGAGNDFIAFDNRETNIPDQVKPGMAKDLCRRGHSVGADGLLFIEKSDHAHFLMRVINADGSEAETCGNASRCAALLAKSLNIAPDEMVMETGAGLYKAKVSGNTAIVTMTDPLDMKLDIHLKELEELIDRIHFVNTGVPHVSAFVDNVEQIDVNSLGRIIRNHPVFQPAGTNVNFATVIDPHNIRIRTYERGVENETLACGTGCIATAVLAGVLNMAESPVKMLTRGGFTNIIHFSLEHPRVSEVRLEGEARIVFTGEMEYPSDETGEEK